MFGTLIKQARTEKGLTQKMLAKAIGCTPSFITKIEKEEELLSFERARVLADTLSISLETLWADVEREKINRFLQKAQARAEALRKALVNQRNV